MSSRFSIFLLVVCWLLSIPSVAQRPLQRFAFHRGLMGTQFNLILFAPDSLIAQRANAAVSIRMDSLNQVMSDYLDGSEINRLSATAGTGRWVPVSADLFEVLQKAHTIARKSHGRFDPTVGPLSLLWRRAVRRNQFPSVRERRQARRAVGYRFMALDTSSRSVRLRRKGMRLDVGGIGQGFAVDEALEVLGQLGIRSVLIDLGGDILAGDAPPESPAGWRISIGSGNAGDSDTTTILLKNAAITTSGDTYRFLEHKGRRYSHIMNPRSGLGLRHFTRATVLTPDGYRADALTKVFSVARGWPFRWSKSRRLLRRFPNSTVLILENKRGQLHKWQSTPF